MGPDQIRLRGILAWGCHGVYPQEKTNPQPFRADVTLDLVAPARNDDLATTVNYAELAESIAAVITGESVDLIETLAEKIAALCLDNPLVAKVEVKLHKPQAAMPVPVADVSVRVKRGRN